MERSNELFAGLFGSRIASVAERVSTRGKYESVKGEYEEKYGKGNEAGSKAHDSFRKKSLIKDSEMLVVLETVKITDCKIEYQEVEDGEHDSVRDKLVAKGYVVLDNEKRVPDPILNHYGLYPERTVLQADSGDLYGLIVNPPYPLVGPRGNGKPGYSKYLLPLAGLAAVLLLLPLAQRAGRRK